MIYLDANVIIRLIEGTDATRAPLEARVRSAALLTSALSRLECRCRPLRDGDVPLLALHDTFFAAAELRVLDVDFAVIEEATRLRAAYGFKTPDAIHLAAAVGR